MPTCPPLHAHLLSQPHTHAHTSSLAWPPTFPPLHICPHVFPHTPTHTHTSPLTPMPGCPPSHAFLHIFPPMPTHFPTLPHPPACPPLHPCPQKVQSLGTSMGICIVQFLMTHEKNCTCLVGTGFHWVWVWVHPKIPRGYCEGDATMRPL